MATEEKRQAVAELADLLRNSSALAVADYRGLKVSEMQAVRRSLKANGAAAYRQEPAAEDRRGPGGSRGPQADAGGPHRGGDGVRRRDDAGKGAPGGVAPIQ